MPKPKIEFAYYDGDPVRLGDWGEIWVLNRYGTWYVPSRPTQVYCYDAGVLSEQEYYRRFGHDLPPLPDTAFCHGWRSPLI